MQWRGKLHTLAGAAAVAALREVQGRQEVQDVHGLLAGAAAAASTGAAALLPCGLCPGGAAAAAAHRGLCCCWGCLQSQQCSDMSAPQVRPCTSRCRKCTALAIATADGFAMGPQACGGPHSPAPVCTCWCAMSDCLDDL